MRILLICPFFPPENKIAAVRIAKFAEHWARAGHEVRVLTRDVHGEDLAIPKHENLSVHRVGDPMARSFSAVQTLKPSRPNLVQRALGVAYTKALGLIWPDVFGRWSKAAKREALSWRWKPEVVVASVGPFSTLRLGSSLANHFEANLVVDYRDLLTLSTYYPHGSLRRRIDGRIERRIASQASLLATVSAPLAEELAEEYGRPTAVVTNGFDPKDFEPNSYDPGTPKLRIAYCGWVIPRKRDPEPFLRGVKQFLTTNPGSSISVDFYGPPSAEVNQLSDQLGLADVVVSHGKVSHAESLRIQANSDVLLLLLWNDPGEVGVLSGKVFEYIGARRPILMTGYADGAAGRLISDNRLGFVGNEPSEIASFLGKMHDEKVATGTVAAPSSGNLDEFTRDAQSQAFLDRIVEVSS